MQTKEFEGEIFYKYQEGQNYCMIKYFKNSTKLFRLIKNSVNGCDRVRKQSDGNINLHGKIFQPSNKWIKVNTYNGDVCK